MTDNYDEAQFQRVYAEYIQTTNRLSEENDVLMLAAVMTTIGLSLYRTSLSSEDYDKMIEAVCDFKDVIKTLDKGQYVN